VCVCERSSIGGREVECASGTYVRIKNPTVIRADQLIQLPSLTSSSMACSLALPSFIFEKCETPTLQQDCAGTYADI